MNKSFILLILFVTLLGMAGVVSAAVDINNVNVSAIKTTSVVINWDSTVAGTSQIEYGPTVSYGSITPEESLSYFHTTELSGLTAGTLYHFRIRSKEYSGAETISPDYTFTTRTQAELEAVIKAARVDGGLPKTYYVSPTGSDANNGLSVSTPFQHPSYAVNKTDAGDTVYLMDGTYTDEHIIFPKSGIDVAPITLIAYNGTPTLDGGTTGTALDANGMANLLISGLTFRGYSNAIYISATSDNVTINNSYFDSQNSSSIRGGGGLPPAITGVEIFNNMFVNTGAGACSAGAGAVNTVGFNGAYIHNNIFRDSPGYGAVGPSGYAVGNRISNNTITNVSGEAAITNYMYSDNTVVEFNVINGTHACGAATGRGIRFDKYGKNIMIWGNIVINTSGIGFNIYPGNQVYAYNNTIVGSSFTIYGYDSTYENNFWINSPGGTVEYAVGYPQSTNITFKNNVFANFSSSIAIHNATVAFKNNIFYSASVTADAASAVNASYNNIFASTLTGFTSNTNIISADPLFANPAAGDFHLKSQYGRYTLTGWVIDAVTSPAIDAGDPVDDYSQEPLPNGNRINIGAYGNTPEASKSITTTIDINQDGVIDISDLRLVALHFGETTSPPYPRYDVNTDGTVDILDLRQVAEGM